MHRNLAWCSHRLVSEMYFIYNFDPLNKHKNEADQDTCKGGEVCSNLTPLVGHRGLRLRMADLLSHRSCRIFCTREVVDACGL